MAQPGNFTPILLYGSSTPTNVPLAANLTNSATGSEIAINVADKNLFFKDSGGVVNTVPIRQSSTSSNGWLSSTDWNTFNNKAPAGAYLTAVTADSPLSGAGTSASHLVIAQSNTSTSGYLSSTDWNTFNGKQAALVSGTNIKTVGGVSLLGSGDVGTIGVGYGGTGQTSFTAGRIIYGNGASALSSSANLFFTGTNLGVGTSTPESQLEIFSYAAGTGANATYPGAILINSGATSINQGGGLEFKASTFAAGYGNLISGIGVSGGVALTFSGRQNSATWSEYGRFDPSGNWLVGGTAMVSSGKALIQWTSAAGVDGLILYDTDATNVGRFAQKFNRNGTVVGSIQTTLTATFYVVSSDYRLKNNIAPMTGALNTVKQLKPVTYNWKADGSSGQGFIAHELQAVAPYCVVGEKDAVNKDGSIKPQGIDTSFLVATLTAAIQELNDKFDAYVASHP